MEEKKSHDEPHKPDADAPETGAPREPGDPSPEMVHAEPAPETGPSVEVPDEVESGLRSHHAWWATGIALVFLLGLSVMTNGFDSFARDVMALFGERPSGDELETMPVAPVMSERSSYTFEELDIHPDVVFRPYTAGQVIGEEVGSTTGRMIEEFRDLLKLYEQRMAIDDNFTVRVVDNRNDEVLELFELTDQRTRYENLDDDESWDWGRIDGMRRDATNQLVRKYAARGIPRDAITVKWGRSNQVHQARRRDEPYIEYEVRLARYLGLSLLATEIGTVETFNQDWLVSSVGARSRYQMMPYVLRQNGIYHYDLKTSSGRTIDVIEERHTLLTMEAAFRTLAGYVNAVGHEIPGISAYHTGPGNIYKVYRMFVTEGDDLVNANSTVMDAYMWAVTTGFDRVSSRSSFKTHSRGYVASAYGALRATQDVPIDTSRTVTTERVQVASGKELYLSEILNALDDSDLRWHNADDEDIGAYEGFRRLNPHIRLPELELDGPVPSSVDVRFVSTVSGNPVRFFLPLGASRALAAAGVEALDASKTFTYDRNAFGRPPASEVTLYDRQYQDLIRDIAKFGFNRENKQRLFTLEDRFEELARSNPSHYRQTQLDVIQTHAWIWRFGAWDTLRETVAASEGINRAPVRPPAELGSGQDPASMPEILSRRP